MTPYTTTIRFGITLGVKKKKARGLTPLTCTLDGGRYKIRTCDPFRVREVRYLCANRPKRVLTYVDSRRNANRRRVAVGWAGCDTRVNQ